MSGISLIPLLFVILITVATVGLGIYATRMSRTASDFFVAGRTVSVFWNASAISGEYLSAASFMGVAGILMKNGYDGLWYPVGYATGYLFLLLFIAGPLRRFGAYTIPDFAEGRFDSPLFRKVAVTFVLFIGFFYTMPQMKAAGVTLGSIMGWPYPAGILIVGTVITFNVALGGMKGITFVQAFQYWAKMFAIAAPIFVLMTIYGSYGSALAVNQERPGETPRVSSDTELKFKGGKDAPANALALSAAAPTMLHFPRGVSFENLKLARKLEFGETSSPSFVGAFLFPSPGTAPLTLSDWKTRLSSGLGSFHEQQGVTADYLIPFGSSGRSYPPGTLFVGLPITVMRGQQPVLQNEKPTKTAPRLDFAEPTTGVLLSGSPVPNAPSNRRWIEPYGPLSGKYGHGLLYTYSLIIALVCGTAGLPHILVRFYTNPDGRAAKRTTLWVMVLIGTFYLFPPIWGALGRMLIPSLYANNSTDTVVIRLPMMLENRLLGQILSGITSAGAFAAFMSTFSGLLVSMSGALAHDIYGKILRPHATPQSRLMAFRFAAIAFGTISMLLGLLVSAFDIAAMVAWAFAIAAASYFPLLLLGSWWRGLTKYGAALGMLSGGLLSLGAIVCSMLLDKKVLNWQMDPTLRSLMEQPAIWAVPLSVLMMVLVSLATRHTIPYDIELKMLRLHAPEELGLSKNYIET